VSLPLHPKCIDRLNVVIAEILQDLYVEHRMFPDWKGARRLITAETVLPESGNIKRALEQYIGETPLFEFIYHKLYTELSEGHDFERDANERLVALEGYGDSAAVAARLVADFASLPWRYSLCIALPSSIGDFFARTIKNYTVSENLKLITPDEAFSAEYSLTSGIERRDRSIQGPLTSLRALMGLSRTWEKGTAHIQVFVDGFIGSYGVTAPLEEGIATLKAFLGIAIALRMLKVKHTPASDPTKPTVWVHRKIADKWLVERTHELAASDYQTLSDLEIHDLNGTLSSDELKEKWAQTILQ
jgi:hypothetical protein